MTTGGPPAQYGPNTGAPTPAGYQPMMGGPEGQPGRWQGGHVPPPPGIRRGGKLLGIGVVIAIVLAAAALVVSLVRTPDSPSTAASATTTAAPSGDTSAADKALCEKVAPLLREVVDLGKDFVALGYSGTPERDNGIPAFRAQIEDWAKRIQPILDAQSKPPSYLTRTLQTEVDFKQLYASNIRPGPEQKTDAEAWDIAAIAHGGPYEVCHALGVTW